MAVPGAYRCVCVELQVHSMVVSAVVNAGLLGELEGTALADMAQESGPAFRVLSHLVNNWLTDASVRGNQ
jgi:DNA polymerase epsilon subunit 1